MKVTIEFELRKLDPIDPDDPDDAPSDPLTDLPEVEGKVQNALAYGAMENVEQALFDLYGWTFDDHKVTVTD